MGNWLDDAAHALASGRFSRRQVLRRAAAAAGGGLVASLAGPVGMSLAGEKCGDQTCGSDEFCCGDTCFKDRPTLDCCHSFTYNPREFHCCSEHDPGDIHACLLGEETCCGKDECCKHDEFCCGGSCFKDKSDLGCCHESTYNRNEEDCCPHHRAGKMHACFKDETCCGLSGCCGKDEECCGGGASAHCAPKGKCGTHCGGKVCAKGETCCDGRCCAAGHCHGGECLCGGAPCTGAEHCCHGHQCCTGVCCHDSCCVFATDQCCSNNGGCCAAKDICCPQGCCIYGCTADGGCASPPTAPDVRLYPRAATLA